jgi:tetratricopeptide (TPR) repeat protein
MSLARAAVVFSLCASVACSTHTRPALNPDAFRRLDSADALARVGCLNCLEEAFVAYEAVRNSDDLPTPLRTRAATSSIQTALRLALRERELGVHDNGYLQQARALIAGRSDLDPGLDTFVAILETIPGQATRVGRAGADLAAIERFRMVRANRLEWLDLLRARADKDPFAASLWIAFSCAYSPQAERQPGMFLAALPSLHDTPSVTYALATCGSIDDARLAELLRQEPRFKEVEFWIGTRELAAQHLDEAQTHLMMAFEWHPRWPSAALALADIAMTAEDLTGALRLYDSALQLLPDLPDAVVGRVRALSYLGRYADALAAADDLIRIQWFPGEAAYWRAWNEMRLGRIDDAWTDVQQAERLWVNAEVSKLAGTIAAERGELVIARARFQTARRLNAMDCETQLRLGLVEADQRDWMPAAEVFAASGSCLEGEKADLTRQIESLEKAGGAPERTIRQTASRRRQLAKAERMQAQAWFNAAAADFNVSRRTQAREYAQKVQDDPEFGARARELISRLGELTRSTGSR